MESDLRDGVQAAARSRVGLGIYERYRVATTPWGRKVWQLKDVDWDLVRRDGTTNLAAAQRGLAPVRYNGGQLEVLEVSPQDARLSLHHLGQEESGTLAESWWAAHKKLPAPEEGLSATARATFARERRQYWQWRASQVPSQR